MKLELKHDYDKDNASEPSVNVIAYYYDKYYYAGSKFT